MTFPAMKCRVVRRASMNPESRIQLPPRQPPRPKTALAPSRPPWQPRQSARPPYHAPSFPTPFRPEALLPSSYSISHLRLTSRPVHARCTFDRMLSSPSRLCRTWYHSVTRGRRHGGYACVELVRLLDLYMRHSTTTRSLAASPTCLGLGPHGAPVPRRAWINNKYPPPLRFPPKGGSRFRTAGCFTAHHHAAVHLIVCIGPSIGFRHPWWVRNSGMHQVAVEKVMAMVHLSYYQLILHAIFGSLGEAIKVLRQRAQYHSTQIPFPYSGCRQTLRGR